MRKPLVILGGGGHAKVILDVLEESGLWTILGYLSETESGPQVLGYPCLGCDEMLGKLYLQGVKHAFAAVGNNELRRALFMKAQQLGFELPLAVSSRSHVSERAQVGRGTAIMAGAVVQAEAEIGDGVIINTGATVDHDCRVGAFSHIGPGAHLAGSVFVGEGALLGTGCCLIPGVRVGAWAIVGAGAVVVRDVPDRMTVVGVPAKPIRGSL